MGGVCRSEPWVFRAVLGGKQSHTWQLWGSLWKPQVSTLVRPKWVGPSRVLPILLRQWAPPRQPLTRT